MCACEPSFVCVACRDTRNDDIYLEDERPELEPDPFVRDLEVNRG